MKIFFSLILLLQFINISIYAQDRFTVEFSGSIPFIPEIIKASELVITHSPLNGGNDVTSSFKLVERYTTKPGLSLNLGFERQLNTRFEIYAGLGFSFHNFQKGYFFEIERAQNNFTIEYENLIGKSFAGFYGIQSGDTLHWVKDYFLGKATVVVKENVGNTKMLYLAIPVKMQYSIIPGRFKMGIGLTNYLVALSGQIKYTREYRTGWKSYLKEYNDKSSRGLNNYLLNGVLSMEYRIAKSFWIQTGYNHGFLSIYDNRREGGETSKKNTEKAKYRIVEVGLKSVF